jgi:hypothetical protein
MVPIERRRSWRRTRYGEHGPLAVRSDEVVAQIDTDPADIIDQQEQATADLKKVETEIGTW